MLEGIRDSREERYYQSERLAKCHFMGNAPNEVLSPREVGELSRRQNAFSVLASNEPALAGLLPGCHVRCSSPFYLSSGDSFPWLTYTVVSSSSSHSNRFIPLDCTLP